jgi:hypothetical protein
MADRKVVSASQLEDASEQSWEDFDRSIEQEVGVPQGSTAPSAEPEPDPIVKAFDDKFMEGFNGLAYIGKLEHSFDFAGHTFVIKTLTRGEKLEVGKLASDYEDSLVYPKAFASAVAAGAIVSVDGQPVPVVFKGISPIRQRFDWVNATWHDPVVDEIYNQAEWLENQVLGILATLGVLNSTEPQQAVEIGET